MKAWQSILVGGALALGLAACSSTGSGGASASSGSSAAGATASGDGSNNATNTASPATPPVLDGASPPPNVPTGAASDGVNNGVGNR